MKFFRARKSPAQWHFGIEGLLLILAACPFIFSFSPTSSAIADTWRIYCASAASVMFLSSAFFMLRKPALGKYLSGFAAVATFATALPLMAKDPGLALFGAVLFILALYNLKEMFSGFRLLRAEDKSEAALQRARWAAICLIAASFAYHLLIAKICIASELALLTASVVAQLLSIFWSVYQSSNFYKATCIVLNALTLLLLVPSYQHGSVWIGSFTVGISLFILLPGATFVEKTAANWWELLLHHSARVTLVTFFMLCLFGTILLFLPGAASEKQISLIDAAFTSVSAVCVTGLIVLDTPHDFSLLGQAIILLLIQLGGLGIMTVTTVAFYALGRRLSLSHEKVLNSTYRSEQTSLSELLIKVVKFTAVSEITGAIILSLLFYQSGMPTGEALWQGIFTSISAFCNAGFALQSSSLIPFQKFPAILHTVALLIIIGGLAPAVTMAFPAWLSGRRVALAIRIALVATVSLLLIGTVVFMIFEWNGALAGLSIVDKIHNAWFQSVTLRTAGFNSVPLENVLGPTYIVMICLMFIGGSPGGTAGGVKTVTFGILIATFWSSISGYDDITLQERRILPETVYKAVTIIVAGVFLLLMMILMLEVTQLIDSRNLIFEATSALGTVGLSLGATAMLDSVGKIIIMLTMFAGRIGPVTLFTLLSHERSSNAENYLEARINLT